MDNNKMTIVILLVLGFFIYMQYSTVEKLDNIPKFTGNQKSKMYRPVTESIQQLPLDQPKSNDSINPSISTKPSNTNDSSYATILTNTNNQDMTDKIVSGAIQLKAEDLLPKYDEASDFAKENPVSDLLKEQNFLISGYHMGINTVMQSNKIPYHDLRSAPPIPKQVVGPWQQSSYETFGGASARRQFELSSS